MEPVNHRVLSKLSELTVSDDSMNNAAGRSSSARSVAAVKPTVSLRYLTGKEILDGNYVKAIKLISERIGQGEKISPCSDNLEGRALQGDWEMAKSLARQRLETDYSCQSLLAFEPAHNAKC